VDGVQLNCCRNPSCPTFGTSPAEGLARFTRSGDAYTVVSTGTDPVVRCRSCLEHSTLVSNLATVQERDRLLALMAAPTARGCDQKDCANFGVSVDAEPSRYQRFGQTSAGSPRHRCIACGTTFSSTNRATHRLRRPEKTVEVLRYLVNRVAMRRLCELADISADTLYRRIALLHDRCLQFSAHHERPLLDGKPLGRVHLAIDRQQHMLNWGSALDRRPSNLMATASAEARSGYILAQHLNFDPNVDVFDLDLAARGHGDPAMPVAFRRHARVYLPYERLDADQESAEDTRPPSRGALIRDNVAVLAHFQVLGRLLTGAQSIQLSMDREPAIDRAALLTFADRVRDGTLSAFLVRIEKEVAVAQKRRLIADAETLLAKSSKTYPGLTDLERIRRILEDRYRQACKRNSKANERWVEHPYPTMSEPRRSALCLTATPRHSVEDLAWGFSSASLRSIDRYFMQLRRKVHLLERPMKSSSTSRMFYAYSPYSAVVVMRLIEIFRTVYNYHFTGQQASTPAMRLGLAERVYSLEDLIEGPAPAPRARARSGRSPS
jgi:transposase-like protein